MTLQQIARRNFNLYYIQENLIELKAKQIAENQLMNEAEEFAEVQTTLFSHSLLLHRSVLLINVSIISFASHCSRNGNLTLSTNLIKN